MMELFDPISIPEPGMSDTSCRACMVQDSNDEMQFLYDDEIIAMFSLCTSLTINPADGLPSYLCKTCHKQLLNWNEFRLKCNYSDIFFRQKIAIKCEEETDLIADEPFVTIEHKIGTKYGEINAVLIKTDCEVSANKQLENSVEVNECILENEKKETIDKDSTATEYVCDICNKSLTQKHWLEAHLRKHMGLEPFACHVCGKEFQKWANLLIHKNNIHKRAYKEKLLCTYEGCNKAFSYQQSLKLHINEMHLLIKKRNRSTLPTYTCDICQKKFFKTHYFEAHLRQHQGLSAFQCKPCEKDFVKWSSLLQHNKLKHSTTILERFICDYEGCGKSYNTNDSLRAHKKFGHLTRSTSKATANYVCELCGKSFVQPFSLKEHKYSHTGEQPFSCTICPKKFISKYALKIHVMRHKGIKRHVCTICGIQKTTLTELKTHINHHTKEKTYPCLQCPSVFIGYNNLYSHVRSVHRDHRPYTCSYCKRSFSKTDALKHHIMIHTGEKPHACPICERRFIQNSALRKHIKIHNKSKEHL